MNNFERLNGLCKTYVDANTSDSRVAAMLALLTFVSKLTARVMDRSAKTQQEAESGRLPVRGESI